MLDKIQVGSQIQVRVTKQPTNEGARKTLVRVLSKDPAVRKEDQRMTGVRRRNYAPRPRGGRLYGGYIRRVPLVNPVVGAEGTFKATAGVLSDLRSVQRFVEVSQA